MSFSPMLRRNSATATLSFSLMIGTAPKENRLRKVFSSFR